MSCRQRSHTGIIRQLNSPMPLQEILNCIITSSNPHHLERRTTEVNQSRASAMNPPFQETIIDDNVCNVQNLSVDILNSILRALI
jgi:hypothetical protein